MDAQVFGAFVQTRRKELGLSQAQLAEKLHVTAKAVSRWERGIGFPDIKLLEPLADALEITIVELMHSQLIEQDIPKETAAVLVSETVNTIQTQEKLSRRNKWKLFLGSFIIFALQVFLFWVYHTYDFQPWWVGSILYFLALLGGRWCYLALRYIITGEPMPTPKLRKVILSPQVWAAMIAAVLGLTVILCGLIFGGFFGMNRETVCVCGMFWLIVGGILYFSAEEAPEE